MVTHYHVGRAMGGGYMPDPDGVYTTTDLDDALSVLVDELDAHREGLTVQLDYDYDGLTAKEAAAYRDAIADVEASMVEAREAKQVNTSARGAVQYAGLAFSLPNHPASGHDLGEDYWLAVCEEDCELDAS